MGVYARRAVYAAAALAVGGMIATALLGTEIRIHMVVCILALITGLTAAATLFTRPNENLLAHARLRLAAMQVDGTMQERDEDDDPPAHWFRHSA